jgi:hypothetical protein
MCPQKYLFTYLLGMKDKDNGKAMMGNVCHKNLELLGKQRIAQQNKKRSFIDEEFGKITFAKCSIEYFNEVSHAHYEKLFPGIMPANSKKLTLEWTHLAVTKHDGEMNPLNQNVHAVEEFFEVEVPHDWAKYSYKIGDEVIEGRLGLKGTVDLIVKEDDVFFHIMDYKGLPVETPIATPSGWTTMEQLKVGDLVFDQYGKPTKVTVKSSQSVKECYQITFDDTSSVVCDDEHYWALANDSVVQVQDLKCGDKIRVAGPIECDRIELPLDPYTLGIWLGDGRNRGGEITSGDSFIFEEIERRGFHIGKDSEKRECNCSTRTIFGLTKKLRPLNLLHNKHIPEIYFRASFEQRLDLLRGLMDSDGSANSTREQCVFMNCREVLSDDIKKLLITLGQRPLKSKTIAKGFGLTVRAFPVSFRPVGINPFLLPIKANKTIGWGPGRSSTRRIKSIEKVDPRITQCISVDSPDETYLCTENMIPTHNTGRRYNWATDKVKTYDCLAEDKQLLLYYYALRLKYPERKFYISIYYINDHTIDKVMVPGGVFTFAFDDKDFLKAEGMIKKEFETIRDDKTPRVISKTCNHFKCKHLCAFSKIIPEISPDTPACIFIRSEIERIGLDAVTEKYADLSRMKVYSGGGRQDVDLNPKD